MTIIDKYKGLKFSTMLKYIIPIMTIMTIMTIITANCFADTCTKNKMPEVGKTAFCVGKVILEKEIKKILEDSYQSSKELQSKYFESLGINTKVATQFSNFLPSINSTFSSKKNKTFNSGDNKDINAQSSAYASRSKNDSNTAGLDLKLNIFAGGGHIAAYRAAFYDAVSGWANFLSTEQKILEETLEAILGIHAQEARLEAQNSNVKFLSQNYEAVKQKAELGESSMTDLALAISKLEEAKAGKNSINSELVKARQTLERLTGKPTPKNLPFITLSKNLLPKKEQAIIRCSQKHNPSIIAAKHALLSAKENKTAVTSSLLPSVDFEASANHIMNDTAYSYGGSIYTKQVKSRATTTSFGLTARMPLYLGGKITSQRRGAKYTIRAKSAQLIDAQRKTTQNVKQVWSMYQSSLENIQLFKSQVKQQKIALDGIREEYNLGSKTIIEVLNVQKDYLSSQKSLIDAKKTYSSMSIKLLAMMGSLNAKLFTLDVKQLDPKYEYYNSETFF